MPETRPDYIVVLHEIDRADFFATVPNYKSNLEIEKVRMEAAHPGWDVHASNGADKAAYHASNKYGVKSGSPNKEE